MIRSSHIGSHFEYQCPLSQNLESQINFLNLENSRLFQENVALHEQISNLEHEFAMFRKREEALSLECKLIIEDNNTLSNKLYLLQQNENTLIGRINETEKDYEKLRSCVFQFIFRLKSNLLIKNLSQSDFKDGTTDTKTSVRLSVVMKDLEESLSTIIKQSENCVCAAFRHDSSFKKTSANSKTSSIKSYNENPIRVDDAQSSIYKTGTMSTFNRICGSKCSCNCKCHSKVPTNSIEIPSNPNLMVNDDYKLENDGEAYINMELTTEEDVNPELGNNLEDEELNSLKDVRLSINVSPACAREPTISEDMVIIDDENSKTQDSKKIKLSKSKLSQISNNLKSKLLAMNMACPDSSGIQNDAQFRASSNSKLNNKKRPASSKDKLLVQRLNLKKNCIHTYEYFYGDLMPIPKK